MAMPKTTVPAQSPAVNTPYTAEILNQLVPISKAGNRHIFLPVNASKVPVYAPMPAVSLPGASMTVQRFPVSAVSLPVIIGKVPDVRPTSCANGKVIPGKESPFPTVDLTQDISQPVTLTSRSTAPTMGPISLKPWSLASAFSKVAMATPATIVHSAKSKPRRKNSIQESLASTSNNGKRNSIHLDQSFSTDMNDLNSNDNLDKVEPFQFVCVSEVIRKKVSFYFDIYI